MSQGKYDAETIARLAQTVGSAVPDKEGNPLYAALPEDVRIHDLEAYLPAPRRQRGTVVLHDPASFGRFVKGQHIPGTMLFAHFNDASFTAVFNPGDPADPNFGDHRAFLRLRLSRQWKAWASMHKNWKTQHDFAEFLQDQLEDVVEPAAADLLAVAQNLQAKKNVNYKSGINLANGAIQFEYDEQVEAKGKGFIEVPEVFVIGVPVYEGGESYRIRVRLRWRITGEKQLVFRVDLAEHDRVVEDAYNTEQIAIEVATGLTAFRGEANGLILP